MRQQRLPLCHFVAAADDPGGPGEARSPGLLSGVCCAGPRLGRGGIGTAGHLVAGEGSRKGRTAVATSVCEMLGIQQPIIQARMAAVPALAAAVSQAGALGVVTLTWPDDAGAVAAETAALTGRPFGGKALRDRQKARPRRPPHDEHRDHWRDLRHRRRPAIDRQMRVGARRLGGKPRSIPRSPDRSARLQKGQCDGS